MSESIRPEPLSPVKRALTEIRELKARIVELESRHTEPVAIVGLSLRTPGGVTDAESFARLLWSGTDAITGIPKTRWSLDDWYDGAQETPGRMYTRFGGFIDEVDMFDAEFFGIAGVEAENVDPQQRLMLELSWEALENAGHSPASLAGSETGVYLGISNSDYGRALLSAPLSINPYSSPGTAFSVAAGRIAYVLGLHGPAISVDTACSSSLVAIHLACQALRLGECTTALAGGVNLILTPELNINFSKAGMLSRDGRCRAFDAGATGYVRGEGGGMVVLRRLTDAVADGDRILAVIRGSAVNQDGRSNGLTAPSGAAQQSVIRAALANAGVEPLHLGYVEAHGTGTSLGDPIELQALAAVVGKRREDENSVFIGSVKSNIGHLEAAAGVIGVIKTILTLQRHEIPPSLHFNTPNPYMDWDSTSLLVPTTVTPWPSVRPRLAGVSAFGFSGTNAHVVLEEAPTTSAVRQNIHAAETQLLPLSARDPVALRDLAIRFRDLLRATTDHADSTLADICFTAAVGRAHFAHRLSVTGVSAQSLAAALDAWLEGRAHPDVRAGIAAAKPMRPAFLFPGQGPQYAGMGRELYDTSPDFRRAFDSCAREFDGLLEQSLTSIVFDEDSGALSDTTYAQPAMFAIEYALAGMWQSYGIPPAVVIGHSFGEYAAACTAGVLTLADAARLVVARGRLVAALPDNGAMIVVQASEAELRSTIDGATDRVDVAAVNGPMNCVVSGERTTVQAIAAQFAARGRRTKALRVSHAFHSPLVDPMLDAFEHELSSVQFSAQHVPFVSGLAGGAIDNATLGNCRYWRDHLRSTVQFAKALASTASLQISHFVEMSPHPVLLGMAEDIVAGTKLLASMRKDSSARGETLRALQQLYVDGATIQWSAVAGMGRKRVALPTYPFQRRRFWHDAMNSGSKVVHGNDDLWSAATGALDAAATRGPLDLPLDSYAAKWECLNRVTRSAMMTTLRSLGFFLSSDESHTLPTILGGIIPTHAKLVTRWLEQLIQHGVLQRDGISFRAAPAAPDATPDELWTEAERLFVDNRELLAYVENCVHHLQGIVTGSVSALESLFPGGSFELATGLYERSATMRYVNALASAAVEAASRALPTGRILRVLEVGAGTGGTTASLLPVLPSGRAEYTFSDVSSVFLKQAELRFGALGNVVFALFDLDANVAQPQMTLGNYDLIVAANVVHAARDLRAALPRLRSMLAPGGLLILIESTTHFDYFDITTGLMDGWRSFADDLRTDVPLLPPETWIVALRAAGFATAGSWPPPESAAGMLGQHIIMARVPLDTPPGALASASRTISDSAIAVPPSTHSRTLDAESGQFSERMANATPKERMSLMCDVVRDEVVRILRLDPSTAPARNDRLMDLGMDSLMALQLRNALTSTLALPTPLSPTLMFDHPTIGAIASLLLERKSPLVRTDPTSAKRGERASESHIVDTATVSAMSETDIAALMLSRDQET